MSYDLLENPADNSTQIIHDISDLIQDELELIIFCESGLINLQLRNANVSIQESCVELVSTYC